MVNDYCEVTLGKNNRTNGGIPSTSDLDFPEKLVEILVDHNKRKKIANNGKLYVLENYSLNIIRIKLKKLIKNSIIKHNQGT